MEKDLYYTELYEVYKNLLTENQAEVFNLYYLCDLSLGEISDIKGISRQGVSDNIVKTRELLDDYEKKLNLLKIKRSLNEIIQSVEDSEARKKLLEVIGEL